MLKKFFSGLFIVIFTWTIFSITILVPLAILVQPARVKQWVDKSGLYTSLPNTIINQAKSDESGNMGDVSFKDPIVQAAVKKALTPEYIEGATKNIVNGTFVWLDGSETKPTFSVDLLSAKKVFADEVSKGAVARYQSLPACLTTRLPKTTDPLMIDCRPAYGVNIETASAELRATILSNQDFLPKSTITAETLEDGSTQENSVFGSKSQLPTLYQRIQVAPFILVLVLLLAGFGAVMLSNAKRRTVSKLGIIMCVIGILSIATLGLLSVGLSQIEQKYSNSSAPVMKDLLLNVLNAVRTDLLIIMGIISATLIVVGASILILTWLSKRKARSSKNVSPNSSQDSRGPDRPDTSRQSPQTTPHQITTAPEVKKRAPKKLIQ